MKEEAYGPIHFTEKKFINKQMSMDRIIQLKTFNVFGVYRPTQEFFTNLDTSPLTVKGFKF